MPGPLVGAEHFERVYADPAADGRSRGAGPVRPVLVLARPRPADAPGAPGTGRAATARWPGRPGRSSPCRTRAPTSWPTAAARRGARRRCRPTGPPRAAARPDDAGLGRGLLRAGLRRAVPAAARDADRRQRRRRGHRAEGHRPAAHGPPRPADPLPARPRSSDGTCPVTAAAPFTDRRRPPGTCRAPSSTPRSCRCPRRWRTCCSRGRARRTRRAWSPPDDDDRAGPGHRRDAAGAPAVRRRAPDHLGADRRRRAGHAARPAPSCCSTTSPTSAPGRPADDGSTRTAGARSPAGTPTSSRSAWPPTGPARPAGSAPVMLRAVTREVLRRFTLASSRRRTPARCPAAGPRT